ncbi:MAG: glycoside hydrolase family 5 protein [Planctomycetota bacterium]|nr:MAG: glycoside hydrolase family 5 protein [Planctomycetota bacterium]
MAPDRHFLKVDGKNIVNGDGETVVLRGIGLGGWMNMENFITGYPCNEEAQRDIIREVLGEEKYEFFFDKFLEYFFTADDADHFASLGMNALRLPLNYRHFEDDMNPMVIKESGFKHLDRVIDLCAERNIYTILDLHALPGYQNQDWHSDNPTHKALFWKHRHFQDRVVNLWEAFAKRYKDNPRVAGYNPINEPADPTGRVIMPFYERLFKAIRDIDPDHIIFLEGNRYSLDFGMFGEPWPNVVYAAHDYPAPGRIDGEAYPGTTQGIYYDKDVIEKNLLATCSYMLERGTPVWVGEFNPGYLGIPEADEMRFQLLSDQLDIFNKHGFSWSAWTCKDIGYQGLVYAAPDSKWMDRIRPALEKKARLAVDSWTGKDTNIRHIIGPLEETFAKEFPDYNPFPFGVPYQIKRLVRNILLSEPLLAEFGECFRGITEKEIDELMQSFLFRNCVQRKKMAEILAAHA